MKHQNIISLFLKFWNQKIDKLNKIQNFGNIYIFIYNTFLFTILSLE